MLPKIAFQGIVYMLSFSNFQGTLSKGVHLTVKVKQDQQEEQMLRRITFKCKIGEHFFVSYVP